MHIRCPVIVVVPTALFSRNNSPGVNSYVASPRWEGVLSQASAEHVSSSAATAVAYSPQDDVVV